jgi:hypothetical protein
MLPTIKNNINSCSPPPSGRKKSISHGLAYCLLFILSIEVIAAQSNKILNINFQPYYGDALLKLNDSAYKTENETAIQIETFKCYISGIELLNKEQVVFSEKNSFHLLDVSELKSLSIPITTPSTIQYDKIKFNIGIDSLTNVSGAYGGDLDPTKGMYWTWQNGYINFKLEGKSMICTTKNNEFQFHIGGYQFPDRTIQPIILNILKEGSLAIRIDLKKIIDSIDLTKQNQVMSPGKDAVILSEKVLKIFSSN